MSPSNIVDTWVGFYVTFQVDIVSQMNARPHEISPESNFCSGSDCNINIWSTNAAANLFYFPTFNIQNVSIISRNVWVIYIVGAAWEVEPIILPAWTVPVNINKTFIHMQRLAWVRRKCAMMKLLYTWRINHLVLWQAFNTWGNNYLSEWEKGRNKWWLMHWDCSRDFPRMTLFSFSIF